MHSYRVEPVLELDFGQPLYSFRTVPVELGYSKKAFVSFYSANYSIDASTQMFTYPTDRHHIAVWNEDGEILWKQVLHEGNIPSMVFGNFWVCDMNQDGVDEIYFTYNLDELHPFHIGQYCIRVLDPRNGSVMADLEWPLEGPEDTISMMFRRTLFSGNVHGQPVMIRWQGVYKDIYLKAYNADQTLRWERMIPAGQGTRASHCYPVGDFNGDGIDEFFLGQRLVSMDDGHDLYCCEEESWNGHVDMVQPIYNKADGRWYVFSNRENLNHLSPRVSLFDDQGQRIWGAVETGHMHKSWVGRVGQNGELIATSCAIGEQTKTKTERLFGDVTEYAFHAMTGEPAKLPYPLFDTAPVDINGDALHEIIQNVNGPARLIDRQGKLIADLGGKVCVNTHVLDLPGEQIICYYQDGKVRIWADMNANDTAEALARYRHPFYKANQKMPSYDYMMCMFGGI